VYLIIEAEWSVTRLTSGVCPLKEQRRASVSVSKVDFPRSRHVCRRERKGCVQPGGKLFNPFSQPRHLKEEKRPQILNRRRSGGTMIMDRAYKGDETRKLISE
jgi:hypothetical protein